jgi:hypothetical protein
MDRATLQAVRSTTAYVLSQMRAERARRYAAPFGWVLRLWDRAFHSGLSPCERAR